MKIKIYNYYDYLKQGENARSLEVKTQKYFEDTFYHEFVNALNKTNSRKILRFFGFYKGNMYSRIEFENGKVLNGFTLTWNSDYNILEN